MNFMAILTDLEIKMDAKDSNGGCAFMSALILLQTVTSVLKFPIDLYYELNFIIFITILKMASFQKDTRIVLEIFGLKSEVEETD